MSYTLLRLGENSELKGILMISCAIAGLLTSVISNLMVAPWLEVLKMYVIFDSILPVVSFAMIAFIAILNFLTTGEWYEVFYYVAFPIWFVYMSGYLRVSIKYSYWSKWEVIFYKSSVLICGLIMFYTGFKYMNGAYKFTSGFLASAEVKLRELTYLYVFGVVELFFELFRKLA